MGLSRPAEKARATYECPECKTRGSLSFVPPAVGKEFRADVSCPCGLRRKVRIHWVRPKATLRCDWVSVKGRGEKVASEEASDDA